MYESVLLRCVWRSSKEARWLLEVVREAGVVVLETVGRPGVVVRLVLVVVVVAADDLQDNAIMATN